MPDYKKMYLELLDKVEKSIGLLTQGANEAEEIYIQSAEREAEARRLRKENDAKE